MRLKKNIEAIKRLKDNDSGFVDASPQERISMVWELTREVWYFKDRKNVEQRLQRDVEKLIRKSG
ncbi:MAG TPA: hypothetical protein VLB82_11015 [Thermodesulfobacteriota bacterium]|nr:hypothetical protein [Thermodesulfobacteriota bacterium]